MYSILAEIDKYIKEKGIPFASVSFNYSYLPKYINQAILNYLRTIEISNHNGIELGPEEYMLKYDINGNLCLIVQGFDHRTKLVIVNSNDKINLGYPVTIVQEKTIIESACIIEQIDASIQECYSKIRSCMKDNNPIDRVQLGTDISNVLLKNNHGLFNEDIVNVVELNDSVKLITNYIDYLNMRYLEEMKYQDESQMKGIKFDEPESDRIIRRSPGPVSSNSKERINEVIPANDRIKVLDLFKPIFQEYAYSENNKKIDYICYLYRLSSKKLVFVFEPYNGMKYTKIALIDYDGAMSYEEFRDVVKKYLELGYSELSKMGNVVRSSHTSLSSFMKMIQFTLRNNEEEFTNEFFKQKVRKLKEQK